MLRDLTILLFWLTIIFLLASVVIIVVYFYHSRKRTNNYLGKQEFELRYFIQKQVDNHGALTGYECLLRQHNADGSWSLPQQLETLPLQRVIFLLESTFKSLPTEPIQLSINLDYEQIISPEFDYFVRWAPSAKSRRCIWRSSSTWCLAKNIRTSGGSCTTWRKRGRTA